MKMSLKCSLAFVLLVATFGSAHSAGLKTLNNSEWGYGKAYIGFAKDGKVHGSAGCNRFTGRYKQTGKYVKIGPLATTRKMCTPHIMSAERRFLDKLSKAYWYKGLHHVLMLFDRDSELIIKMRRRDWD